MTPRRAAIAAGEPVPIPLSGQVRITLRGAALLLALLIFVPLHYLFRAIAYGSPFPRLFLGLAARICGVRVQKVGTALRRDVVFLANHISWLDILALAGATGTSFVAKAELGRAPVVGWLARMNRTVFVQREARLNVAEQINAVREALADNSSITVFPEGTTTDGQSLLPFKSSVLKMLEPPPPGVMVQPVFIDYGPLAEEVGWIGNESGARNARRILARRGTFAVRLHFLEPFSPEDHPGRKRIASTARSQIEGELRRSLGHPPDQALRPFAHAVPPVRYAGPKPEPDDPPT